MVAELALAHALPKPWGVVDLFPWSKAGYDGKKIGEIWYGRADNSGVDPSLLLKLLFTSQPLSIQVHPNDVFARSMGLPNGKTEAWYILSATPEAKVALGLSRRLTPQQLREAIEDGSIADLIVWHAVSADDVISVPAGTIHAIGAGLVIAELQQRSDTTFRLFDPGRPGSFTSKTPLWWPTPDQPISRRDLADLPPNVGFLFPTHSSYSNGSTWAQTPHGIWRLKGRLGFSSSAAAPSLDHSTCQRAMPFLLNRTASRYTLVQAVWWVSCRIPAAALFRTCCSVSPSGIKRSRTGQMRYRCRLL